MKGNTTIRPGMFYGADPKTMRAAGILRRSMTLPERILWAKLKNRNIFKTKFRRQHPISFFIVDFYCHEFKLVIELDGEIHNNKKNMEYDSGRTAELNNLGLRVIRFSNDEIFENLYSIIDKIKKIVCQDSSLSGY